jgi:hypothetical protein
MTTPGIRTPDLCGAIAALSDLSYSPVARLFTCGGGARDLSGALRRLAFVYHFATLFAVKAKHTAAARAVLLEHVEALRALHSRASEF